MDIDISLTVVKGSTSEPLCAEVSTKPQTSSRAAPESHNLTATTDAVNAHSMVTRAKKGIHKQKVYSASIEPKNVLEAMNNNDWFGAMSAEYLAIMRNETWYLTEFPTDRRAIGCK